MSLDTVRSNANISSSPLQIILLLVYRRILKQISKKSFILLIVNEKIKSIRLPYCHKVYQSDSSKEASKICPHTLWNVRFLCIITKVLGLTVSFSLFSFQNLLWNQHFAYGKLNKHFSFSEKSFQYHCICYVSHLARIYDSPTIRIPEIHRNKVTMIVLVLYQQPLELHQNCF
ncbi:hypothetical protein AGLY_005529 [Aphis glycines]|uniref:Uncharacterized protein n=1 Tax=Aphis glycines TaxID=307491 RepID=A0A6G0TV63_APHGL|nr:hypothetical protein AGLY_005529 [Aphis glycines]